jgi:hypothetical protein
LLLLSSIRPGRHWLYYRRYILIGDWVTRVMLWIAICHLFSSLPAALVRNTARLPMVRRLLIIQQELR